MRFHRGDRQQTDYDDYQRILHQILPLLRLATTFVMFVSCLFRNAI